MRLLMIVSFVVTFTVFNALTAEAAGPGKLGISSTAFGHNDKIPGKYTCDSNNINPPLKIDGVPGPSKSLALIVDDPDAPVGTWVHWVVWNISPGTVEIKENSVPEKSVQGVNDFKKHEYGGPCPPWGQHRYFFKLYALDTVLNISPDSKKADLEKAMKGHIISQAELMGLYKRK
jgi:Raf kinase inhibitor-like YbhB/YbcL family protein